jgi:hypothetical protein
MRGRAESGEERKEKDWVEIQTVPQFLVDLCQASGAP